VKFPFGKPWERKTEAQKLGITSFVWRASRPLHPERLFALASDLPRTLGPEVIRSKGFLWLATRPTLMGVFSLAGGRVELSAGEPWWAMVDPREWPEGLKEELLQSRLWDPRYGDRQQELVVIGIGMDELKVRGKLDTCLLTDVEMQQVGRVPLVLYFVWVGGWVGGWVLRACVRACVRACLCVCVCVCVCARVYI